MYNKKGLVIAFTISPMQKLYYCLVCGSSFRYHHEICPCCSSKDSTFLKDDYYV